MLISKWQLSLILTNFPSLADFSSMKLTSENSLNVFYTAPIVKFLPDNIAILNKQVQWQKCHNGYLIYLANTTIKTKMIYWYKQATCGVLAAD